MSESTVSAADASSTWPRTGTSDSMITLNEAAAASSSSPSSGARSAPRSRSLGACSLNSTDAARVMSTCTASERAASECSRFAPLSASSVAARALARRGGGIAVESAAATAASGSDVVADERSEGRRAANFCTPMTDFTASLENSHLHRAALSQKT